MKTEEYERMRTRQLHTRQPTVEGLSECRCGEQFCKTARNYGYDYSKFLHVHAAHGGVSA